MDGSMQVFWLSSTSIVRRLQRVISHLFPD